MMCRNAPRNWLIMTLALAGWAVLPGPQASAQVVANPSAKLDPTLVSTADLINQIYTTGSATTTIISALRQSRDPAIAPIFAQLTKSDNQDIRLYGMISQVILTGDTALLDLDFIGKIPDSGVVGSAMAMLIDRKLITDAQLTYLGQKAPEPSHRAMAWTELSRRGQLADSAALQLLASDIQRDGVRLFAGVTLLARKDAADQAVGLKNLQAVYDRHDPRNLPLIAVALMRIRSENIAPAGIWVETIARDAKADESLRLTALAAALYLKRAEAPTILADLIKSSDKTYLQTKLALLALEFADQLRPGHIAGLGGKSAAGTLAYETAALVRTAVAGKDFTTDLVKLLKDEHPIVMDWCIIYAQRTTDSARQLALYQTLLNTSKAVDERRERDFERAALAAEKLAELRTPEARALLTLGIKSNQRPVVEATLVGILRSDNTTKETTELVLPHYANLQRAVAFESATNYATLILARDGRPEALPRLHDMVMGGTVQNVGYRALAGWYYARQTKQEAALLARIAK
ncbi:MAG: hypothetical protein WCJ97_08025 [Phycisphaerae bacterium]